MDQLLEQLDLEQIETNLFRGDSDTQGPPRVFGGLVVGQALIAAARTVDARPCHSLHGYFLRAGDPTVPIVYEVDRIRDGKSFTTRRVIAIQKGRAIFNLSASFHVIEEGLSHQVAMPDVPGPEDCVDESEAFLAHRDELPEPMQRMMRERPIEMRRVEQHSFVNPEKRPPFQNAWIRVRTALPDDTSLHQCILAYASDMGILSTCTLPHGMSFMSGLMTASLDHAMWFHRAFRLDDWVLFAQDSPTAGGSRGFNRGMMFSRDGTLIASVAQEGLIRIVG